MSKRKKRNSRKNTIPGQWALSPEELQAVLNQKSRKSRNKKRYYRPSQDW